VESFTNREDVTILNL